MPKVSIIIPTYNCANYLPEALDSALHQTYQDFEIIIIDDGSIDNTKTIVAKYIEGHIARIRYFYKKNEGQAIARNLGIMQSRGEYIALLDADDMWLPDRLREGVYILDKFPNIALVHSNVMRITENGEFFDIPKRKKRFLSGHIFSYLLTQDAHISCPTVLFRKECCNRVGLFDVSLKRLGSEDRDLWLRIAREYEIKYIDKVLAYYRMRRGSFSQDRKKMFDGISYVIDKYCAGNQRLKKIQNQALARVYRDLGDQLLSDRNFKESKKHYLKALSFRPVSFWPLVNFFKASLQINLK